MLRVGSTTADPVRHLMTCDGALVSCMQGEFAVLRAMAAEHGRVSSRRQLLHQTRGHGRASTERAIDIHVMNRRKKVEPEPRQSVQLLTVFGVGCELVGGRHAS
ncbi:helix-turn-helix domain-containing protein [Streptomyces sp. NPDC006527]|uniref:winged helix-turn-helix domain-containing protein n=1 Tax=Streptomyces sp. NPDC006527 TaxID=3364749 RepID=UPI0036BE505A